jgi:two-component system, OmpR family, response regulator
MGSIIKPGNARAAGCRAGVLIIEDDPGVGTEVQAVLEDDGFAVEWVRTGSDGLRRAIDGNFKTIVLDRMLPDVDGLSILSTLRNIGNRTPVLILSALSAVDERVRGLRAGGDDYVTKPFDGLELIARLNAILRRRSPSSSDTVLRVGDLALDTIKRVAERAAQTIELTPREYALLECLMRQAGQVVTRAMLFESAWNYHFDARTNVIDMHIGQLRRRIGLNGMFSSMIHTVRNIGYILDARD